MNRRERLADLDAGCIEQALHQVDVGGHFSARLDPVDAVVSMNWVAAPKVAYYSERVRIVYDDAVFELEFPSPYLNHHPTRLTEWAFQRSPSRGNRSSPVLRRAVRRGAEGLVHGDHRGRPCATRRAGDARMELLGSSRGLPTPQRLAERALLGSFGQSAEKGLTFG